ncbi:mechanosensitive ion channel family protein [Oricola thermophila]|uniref:Mechanosensitive ion channel family protein n=1 Tax=Oricola thermophila TaxID=2742145 RepID=A0A6N1VE67_9HYPH|nr:mechanosensitive ion channel domain-containing protein [Oricola thermophila]QKV17337.1 mechanosensitive ion channel family protein [Oricola thermophila]
MAWAQQLDKIENAVERYDRELVLISDAFDEARNNDGKLVALNERLRLLGKEIIAAGVELSPRVAEIRARLDQLGPVPEQGGEPQALQDQRAELAEERVRVNTLLGKLEEMSIRANSLANEISSARRDLFTSALSKRYDITAAFGSDLLVDLKDRRADLVSKVSSWFSFAWRFKSRAMAAATILSLAAALLFLVFARKMFGEVIRRDPEAEEPGYFARLTVGFSGTLVPAVGVWLFFVLIYALYAYFGVMRGDIGVVFLNLFIGIGAIILVWRLAEAVFAPRLPAWRLVRMSDRAALALKWLVVAMAVLTVADGMVSAMLELVGDSLPITVAKSLISSVAVGVILLIIAAVRPFPVSEGRSDGRWSAWFRLLLSLTGLMLILAALTGYVGFAEFVSKQLVITGAVVATMYLGYLAAYAISREHALAHSRIGERLRAALELSEPQIDQLGLFAGILLTLTILAIGVPVLFLLWGFKWIDIRGWVLGALTEFSVGSITISITGILAGIIVFFIGFYATRLFQRWLEGDVLSRSKMDVGVRNSIKTAVGYGGVTIAGLVGVSAAGLDLSQLALVAGALSLGIGFGLQNIVSNFVSGLILLAERPFKVGDWIEAGGISGTVKSINVRATEIETFQRKTMILPNSDLINSAVGNWTHRNTLGRIEIPVGVSYDSDPKLVRELLMDIAQDHPRILSNPEPFVVFSNFGDSSLDFELRAYLADINYMLTVSSEVRFAVFERFKAAGIEIPFPQRDVNLRIVNDAEAMPTTVVPGDSEFGVIKASRRKERED